MSGRNSPLADIGQAVVQGINSYVEAPPPRKNRKRAVFGTWMLVAGGYGAYAFVTSNHLDAVSFIQGVITQPSAVPQDTLSGVVGWGAWMLFAALWLVVGLSRSHGPRDPMSIFWTLVGIGILAAIAWAGWNRVIDDPNERFAAKGFCYATLAALLMSLYLSIRGPGRSASRMVEDQMRQQQRSWRTGKNRQF